MKKFIAIVLVCLFCCMGCAGLKADIAKVETDIKAVNWSAAATYWADFVKGLNAALPVIETLFPGTKSTVNNVINPVLADANVAVTSFTSTVQAYQAGTLTATQVQTAAQQVQSSVVAASNTIGQAIKSGPGSVQATTAATAAVPTN